MLFAPKALLTPENKLVEIKSIRSAQATRIQQFARGTIVRDNLSLAQVAFWLLNPILSPRFYEFAPVSIPFEQFPLEEIILRCESWREAAEQI